MHLHMLANIAFISHSFCLLDHQCFVHFLVSQPPASLHVFERENRFSASPTRFYTIRHVQSQKKARSLKLRILEEEKLYYPSSEIKGADQLCSDCTADLRLCFRTGKKSGFLMIRLISS